MKKILKAVIKFLLFLLITAAAVILPAYIRISNEAPEAFVSDSPPAPADSANAPEMLEADAPDEPFADEQQSDIPPGGIYDLMLDSSCGPLTYYNQADARWRDYLYGGRDPIKKYGCGPTVMAMLITSLTGQQVLPTDISDWAAVNGCWCPGQGSYHCLIPDCAAAFGLNASPMTDYSAPAIVEALASGHLIVALMRPGHFTNQGHFLILCQYTEDGKIRIADSNRYENTLLDWDPQLIIDELNYNATNGGPLWKIGLP